MQNNVTLPPFESRSEAAQALSLEFPEHGDQIRVAGPQLEALSDLLLEKKAQYRKLALEIAALECDLKVKIGLFKGLKVKKGTWFWEKVTSKPRTNWVTMCRELGITKRLIAAYSHPSPPYRLLRFQREK